MTSDLVPELKKHGISLSREQVYRIATGVPQRLSLDLLAALCAILKCTPNDLIEFKESQKRKRVVGDDVSDVPLGSIRPVRARIVRPSFKDR